jgi:hypothetical protein
MKAEVLRLTAEGMCEARTENGLLVVFRLPAARDLRLSDALEFEELRVDADVIVMNTTQGYSFVVQIAGNNIHDLRLPAARGSSRTPSAARLRGS